MKETTRLSRRELLVSRREFLALAALPLLAGCNAFRAQPETQKDIRLDPQVLEYLKKGLKNYLTNPGLKVTKNGVSFSEEVSAREHQASIRYDPRPLRGRVVADKGLKTRDLPTAEGFATNLDNKYWLRHGEIIEWNFEVILKNSKTRGEERWAARLMPIEVAGNPPAEMWVFNAIEFKGGEKVTTFIKPH